MRTAVLLIAAVLGGCAVSSYCVGEQDYQKAASVPPVKSTEGVPVPQSPSALKIPDPPAKPVAFGEASRDEEGGDVRCLDTPPALVTAPPNPAAAPAPQPAEAPPAAEPPGTDGKDPAPDG